MKLLALVTDAFGGRGGIAKFNRDLLSALASHERCDQVIAVPRVIAQDIHELPSRIEFRRGAARGRLAYAAELIRVLASRKINGVVCGHLRLLPAAALVARIRRVPLILVIHGVEAWDRPKQRMQGSGLGQVDVLVSVSRTTQERFLGWSRIQPRHAFVIPNCVDQSRFGVGPKDGELLRRYRLQGRTVILTVGRLASAERYKGIDEMLELLPALSRDIPQVSHLIVGDGDDRERLEAKAKALGLLDRVVFAGYVPEDEKPAHYRLADVFVMVGRGEGFGIVYLEALACGVPVVASSVDASREAVLDGQLGELASPDHPVELRDAIIRALKRPRGVPSDLQQFSADAFQRRCRELLDVCFPEQAGSSFGLATPGSPNDPLKRDLIHPKHDRQRASRAS